jgi:hypothetical protein
MGGTTSPNTSPNTLPNTAPKVELTWSERLASPEGGLGFLFDTQAENQAQALLSKNNQLLRDGDFAQFKIDAKLPNLTQEEFTNRQTNLIKQDETGIGFNNQTFGTAIGLGNLALGIGSYNEAKKNNKLNRKIGRENLQAAKRENKATVDYRNAFGGSSATHLA